jgi:hypothetical protein
MDQPQMRMLSHTTLVAITLQLSLLMPTLIHLIFCYHMKEPYHTSILSGYAWAQELLHGHPEHIRTELGVHKEVFYALIKVLLSMGHGDSRNVTLQEQLAIFLHMSVTGLSMDRFELGGHVPLAGIPLCLHF